MRHNDEGFRRLLKIYAVNRMVVGAHLSVRPGALNHTLCFLSTIVRKNNDGARANTRVRPYRHIETNNYRIKSNCRGAPCGLPWSLNKTLCFLLTIGRDNNVGSSQKTDCFTERLILPYVLRDYMSRSAQPTADCPLAQPKKFLKSLFFCQQFVTPGVLLLSRKIKSPEKRSQKRR